MTERAKRAAEVLHRLGWSVSESDGKSCARCGHDAEKGARYCSHCGWPLPPSHTDGTLQDLEAAIAAALGETATHPKGGNP